MRPYAIKRMVIVLFSVLAILLCTAAFSSCAVAFPDAQTVAPVTTPAAKTADRETVTPAKTTIPETTAPKTAAPGNETLPDDPDDDYTKNY